MFKKVWKNAFFGSLRFAMQFRHESFIYSGNTSKQLAYITTFQIPKLKKRNPHSKISGIWTLRGGCLLPPKRAIVQVGSKFDARPMSVCLSVRVRVTLLSGIPGPFSRNWSTFGLVKSVQYSAKVRSFWFLFGLFSPKSNPKPTHLHAVLNRFNWPKKWSFFGHLSSNRTNGSEWRWSRHSIYDSLSHVVD